MDLKKERETFEIAFKNKLGAHGCQFDLDEDGNYEDRETLCGWHMWLDAKAQAVPKDSVLLKKSDLRKTYYIEGADYVVDCPSDYELELERGEIQEMEMWDRTPSTSIFLTTIYGDDDSYEIKQFETEEQAQAAIEANKAQADRYFDGDFDEEDLP